MPWSGTGTFSRIYGASGWTDDKNSGTKILSSRHDTHDQDMADGVNACITRDNQAKPTSSFLPSTDNTINLGSGSFRWASINGVSFSNFVRKDAENTLAVASVAAGVYKNILQNTTGTGYTSLRLLNDQSRSLEIDYSGSTYASALITGGPTGESAAIGTISTFPLSLYTNNVERIRLASDGSTVNITATAFQVNTVDLTPSTNTFTATLGGMTVGTTGTLTYKKIGNVVTLYNNTGSSITGTSNTTAMTITGIPSLITPPVPRIVSCYFIDTGGFAAGSATVSATNTITTFLGNGSVFTNSGTKGLPNGWSITYTV
jgi:hypothetical protein